MKPVSPLFYARCHMPNTHTSFFTFSLSNLSRRMRLLILIVVLLTPFAIYRAAGPLRAQRALEHASMAALEARVQADPNDFQAQTFLARRARREGNYQIALTAYRHVAMSDPSDETIWIEFARTAADARQVRLAASILQAFCRKNPDSARGHAALADVYLQDNDAGPALDEAIEATKLDSDLADAWIAKGKAAEAMIYYDQAAGDYRKALDLESQAGDAYRKAIALAPRDWRGYAGLGSLEGSQTQYRDAIGNLRKAVALNPKNGMLYSRLGTALVTAGSSPAELQEGIECLQRAANLEEGMSQAVRLSTYLHLGQAYQEQARWSDALPWLKKAAVLAPGQTSIHYELARAYQGLGDRASAAREARIHESLSEQDIERQRLMDRVSTVPSDSQARLKLARLLAASGDYRQAVGQYRALLQRDPGATVASRELETLQRAHGSGQ